MTTFTVDGHFEFRGIEPDEELVEEASRVYEEIMNLSPYDSSIFALISGTPEGVSVEFEAHAGPAGLFKARAVSKDWCQALREVELQMQRELRDWRNNRFGEQPHHSHPDSRMAA